MAERLAPGGRFGIFGLKYPERWPRRVIRVGNWLNRPFGLKEYAALRPLESVRRHVGEVEHREFLGGAAYLSVGEVS